MSNLKTMPKSLSYSHLSLFTLEACSIHCKDCDANIASGRSVISISCNRCASCSCHRYKGEIHYHNRTNPGGYTHSFLTVSGLDCKSWMIHDSNFVAEHTWFNGGYFFASVKITSDGNSRALTMKLTYPRSLDYEKVPYVWRSNSMYFAIIRTKTQMCIVYICIYMYAIVFAT